MISLTGRANSRKGSIVVVVVAASVVPHPASIFPQLEFEQRIKALERSNTELEHFACDASHDLREPLRVISHLAERLAVRKGECLGDEGHQLLSGIVGELDRMQTLVSQLLESSRVSGGAA